MIRSDYPLPTHQTPPVPPQAPSVVPLDLSDRTLTAALNVAVFTPYAVYLALGKRPPGWLIAASLGWLVLNFADDLLYLVKGEASTPLPPNASTSRCT